MRPVHVRKVSFRQTAVRLAQRRHRSPMTGSICPAVHHIGVVDDENVGRHLHAAMKGLRLPCVGEKADDGALGTHGAQQHPRQAFLRPLHPDLVQPDLGQPGAELATPRWQQFHLRCMEYPLVKQRIGEYLDCATDHDTLPNSSKPEKPEAPVETQGTPLWVAILGCRFNPLARPRPSDAGLQARHFCSPTTSSRAGMLRARAAARFCTCAVDNVNNGDSVASAVAPSREVRLTHVILRRWETIATDRATGSRLPR